MNRSYVPEAIQNDAAAAGPKPEAWYRDLLASQLGGQIEAELPFGRADVLTDGSVFEVEPAFHWRIGVRQVLAYAAQASRQPALALYGKPAMASAVLGHLGQLPPPGVDLWWFTGDGFARIATEEDAAAVPLTAVVAAGPVSRREANLSDSREIADSLWHTVVDATISDALDDHWIDRVCLKMHGALSYDSDSLSLHYSGRAKGETATEAAVSAAEALVSTLWVEAGVKAEVTGLRVLRWEDFAAETFPGGVPEWVREQRTATS